MRRVAQWSRLILMASLTEVRREEKRKDKTNCQGRQILCGIAKICHTSECKQLKGSPYFTRRPLDAAVLEQLTLSDKALHSFVLSLLFSHILLSSLHHFLFSSFCSSTFLPFHVCFSVSLYLLTYCFHSLIWIFPPFSLWCFSSLPLPFVFFPSPLNFPVV